MADRSIPDIEDWLQRREADLKRLGTASVEDLERDFEYCVEAIEILLKLERSFRWSPFDWAMQIASIALAGAGVAITAAAPVLIPAGIGLSAVGIARMALDTVHLEDVTALLRRVRAYKDRISLQALSRRKP